MSPKPMSTTIPVRPNTHSGLKATLSVLIDGVKQPLHRRQDGQYFVVSRPGRVFQLKYTDPSTDNVEIVVFDGEMDLTTEAGLRFSVPIGTIGSTPGSIIIEYQGKVSDRRRLRFKLGSSFIHCVVYNEYRYSSIDPWPKLGDDFERGYRLGDLVIHYGTRFQKLLWCLWLKLRER